MPEIVLPLTIRPATADDRAGCAWSGSGAASSVDRALRGELDYLVVCPPTGFPVAMGGIGTLLIQAMEDRIRDRGLSRAELGVDERVPRPQALYERLGYVPY